MIKFKVGDKVLVTGKPHDVSDINVADQTFPFIGTVEHIDSSYNWEDVDGNEVDEESVGYLINYENSHYDYWYPPSRLKTPYATEQEIINEYCID